MNLPPTYVESFHEVHHIKQVTYKRLGNTDIQISNFSLGGTPFGNNQCTFLVTALKRCHFDFLGGFFSGDMSDDIAKEIIVKALKQGVNYIDTAPWYLSSQERIGKALKVGN